MDLLWSILSLAAVTGSVAASVHLLLRYREPAYAVSWLFALWVLPLLGSLAYLSFAVYEGPRVVRRRRRLSRRLRALQRRAARREAGEEPWSRLSDEVAARAGALPTIGGNRLTVDRGGAEARTRLFELLRGARHEILIETYIWERDELTDELVEVLAERRAAGVEVRLLLDGIGSRRFLGRNLSRLVERGVPFVRFLAPNALKGRFQINFRNHRKIVVVDRRVALLGGRNLSQEYYDDGPDGFRDLSFAVEGPAVNAVVGLFLEDWIVATESPQVEPDAYDGPEPVGTVDVRMIPHGCDEERDVFVPLLCAALRSARESILVVTPYFVPGANVLHDLRIAALSGVRVRILIPERSPERWPDVGARRFFEPLLRAGVEVWIRPAPFLHSKAVVIDERRVFVGSANFDLRSFNLNYELTLEVEDEAFAREVLDEVGKDLAVAERLDPEAFYARPWHVRVGENLVALFAPLL